MPARDYARFIQRILQGDALHERVSEFVGSDELVEFEAVLSLVLAVEPLVLQPTRGLVTFRFTNIEPSWDDYNGWVSAIDHGALMDEVGLSLDVLKGWHNRLATAAVLVDPLERWRVLVRYAPRSERERLKGDALQAEDLYYAAEVLRRYLEDFQGVTDLQEEDNITAGPQVPAMKERFYGKSTTTTADRSVFRNVVRQFGLDPQPRFRWIIEGATEDGFIRRWAELHGASLIDRGVELITLRSVGEIDGVRLRTILDISRTEEVFVSATVDSDGVRERIRRLQHLASDGLLPAGWSLFDPDFEEANFTIDQLAQAATAFARESPETAQVTITPEEIAGARQEGKPVWDAIERVARGKLSYLNKGERWGQHLAEVLRHDAPDEVPVVASFAAALRADGSNYRFTILSTEIGPDGTIVRRPEPRP
jgi:hypothetical protein